MIDINSLPFNGLQKHTKTLSFNSTNFDYSKPLDPVEIIKISSLSNEQKIEEIQKYLVDKCGIIDGGIAKYLAILSLGDKLLISRAKLKMNRKKKKRKK